MCLHLPLQRSSRGCPAPVLPLSPFSAQTCQPLLCGGRFAACLGLAKLTFSCAILPGLGEGGTREACACGWSLCLWLGEAVESLSFSRLCGRPRVLGLTLELCSLCLCEHLCTVLLFHSPSQLAPLLHGDSVVPLWGGRKHLPGSLNPGQVLHSCLCSAAFSRRELECFGLLGKGAGGRG